MKCEHGLSRCAICHDANGKPWPWKEAAMYERKQGRERPQRLKITPEIVAELYLMSIGNKNDQCIDRLAELLRLCWQEGYEAGKRPGG